MLFRRKPKGGTGSNQYQSRGESHQHPGGHGHHTMVEPAVEEPDLYAQVEADRAQSERVRCGEIWENGCKTWVYPPRYAHLGHPDYKAREKASSNANTPVVLLKHLASDQDPWIRCRVASNPETGTDMLEKLSSDGDDLVRYFAAANPNTPSGLSGKLASDPNTQVRRSLAGSPVATSSVLEQLALDPEVYVRLAVAGNKNTPVTILTQLMADPESIVTDRAIHNPSLPDHIRALYQVIRPPDDTVAH